MQDFRYVRLFSDASGESHFQDIAIPPDRELSVPPAPPLRMRALGPAVTAGLVGGDSGWHGEVAHPAPFRMLQSYLSGTVEVTASDGESRRFGPGSLLLLEDTHGRGHSTRILDQDVVLLLTQLAGVGAEPGADRISTG
jgi:hypothetical protein